MGVVAGPIGLVLAYLVTYAVHGTANPLHMSLLHREVTATHRSTVVSLNSLVSMPAGTVGAIALTGLADATSPGTAMVVGGVVLAVAAPLYLPAARRPPAEQRDGALASNGGVSAVRRAR
jgi:hypothetical protein